VFEEGFTLQILPPTTMAEGTLIFTLIFLTSHLLVAKGDSTLTSGLIFDKKTVREIPVNGRQLSFIRRIDIKPLITTINSIKNINDKISNACDGAKSHIDLTKKALAMESSLREMELTESYGGYDIVWGKSAFMRVASTACYDKNSTLFEIRNENDYKMAQQILKEQPDLPVFPSAILFDSQANRLRYSSDGKEPHEVTFKFGGYLNNYDALVNHYDYYFLTDAKVSQAKYIFKQEKVYIKLMTESELETLHQIPCKHKISPIIPDEITTTANEMLIEVCTKQPQQLLQQLKEATTTTMSIFTTRKTSPKQQQQQQIRKKRFALLPTIFAGLGAVSEAATTATSVLDHRSLELQGTDIHQISSRANTDYLNTDEWNGIKNQSIFITDYTPNVTNINQRVAAINNDVKIIQGYLNSQEFSIFTSFKIQSLFQDLDQIHEMILNIIKTVAEAIQESAQGKFSPILLSAKETKDIQDEFFDQGTTKLDFLQNAIKTKVLDTIDGKYINFLLPVITDDDMADIYEMTSFPVFKDDGEAYLPQMDATHLAIFNKDQTYVTLSDTEYLQCLNSPYECTTTSTRISLLSPSSCTAGTFRSRRLNCPLIKINADKASFFIKDNTIYFSSPHQQYLHIQCKQPQDNLMETTTISIQETGAIQLRPMCSVHIKGYNTLHTRGTIENNNYQMKDFLVQKSVIDWTQITNNIANINNNVRVHGNYDIFKNNNYNTVLLSTIIIFSLICGGGCCFKIYKKITTKEETTNETGKMINQLVLMLWSRLKTYLCKKKSQQQQHQNNFYEEFRFQALVHFIMTHDLLFPILNRRRGPPSISMENHL